MIKLNIARVLNLNLVVFCFCILANTYGQQVQVVDKYINQVVKRFEINGLSLAIMKGDKVIHKRYYGHANMEHQVPVNEETIFRVYSSTKAMAAVSIYQLVENGKINLDDLVSEHIPLFPKTWGPIKIQDLLSHASGIPDIHCCADMSEKELFSTVFQKEKVFETATRFSYNQTNYLLLKQIIEKYANGSFEESILNQFADNAQAIFSANCFDIIPHRATRYQYNYANQVMEKRLDNAPTFQHVLNGLNLDINSFINWLKLFNAGKLINDKSKATMWSKYPFLNDDKFGHGWGIYDLGKYESYGFSGGGCVAFRIFPTQNISIIYMTNGSKYGYNHVPIVDKVAALIDSELMLPSTQAGDQMIQHFIQNELTEGTQVYNTIYSKFPKYSLEATVNSLAYELMNKSQNKSALYLFELNTKTFPKSWNVWDSLAEGHEINGDVVNALKFYEKSLDINPDNTHGIERIKFIKSAQ